MRIAIAGGGRLATSLLPPLLASSHQVIAILQDGRNISKRARSLCTLPLFQSSLAVWARHLDIPLLWLRTLCESELTPLRKLSPDVILVSGFSLIFKKELLQLPRIACINMHSSLLPRHRGPNPFSAVIMAKETQSGITFHVMDEGIDTGPILQQVAFPLSQQDHLFDVYQKACITAARHVVSVMDAIDQKGIKEAYPQDEECATYDPRLSPTDVCIDWRHPASQIERLIRATQNPAPYFLFRKQTVYIQHATYTPVPADIEPGKILQVKPYIIISTGKGCLHIHSARIHHPIHRSWPCFWASPHVGEQLPLSLGETLHEQ